MWIALIIALAVGLFAGAFGTILLWMRHGWDPTMPGLRERIGPFVDLLDARYLPLLAVAAPQAYTVYAWLLGDGSPQWVAILGGVGFEFVYVGAISWAERGAGWEAARPPAIVALLFSIGVAVAHYGPSSGALSILHAGFPMVGYAYTLMIHAPAREGSPKALRRQVAQLAGELAQARQDGEQLRRDLAQAAADLARTPDLLAQRDTEAAQLAEDLRQAQLDLSRSDSEVSRLRAALAQAAAQPRLTDDAERLTVNGKAVSVRRLSEATGIPLTTLRRQVAQIGEA